MGIVNYSLSFFLASVPSFSLFYRKKEYLNDLLHLMHTNTSVGVFTYVTLLHPL